jgi:cobalt-zinc-cadmium efflux system membrane fusion protein
VIKGVAFGIFFGGILTAFAVVALGMQIPGLNASGEDKTEKQSSAHRVQLLAEYQITPKVIAALQTEKVSAEVLRKLEKLATEKPQKQALFMASLRHVLDKDEVTRYRGTILAQAVQNEHAIEVPQDVRTALGIHDPKKDDEKLASAFIPEKTHPLVLSGSVSMDPTKIKRIRARFAPAEVVTVGELTDLLGPKTGVSRRELRSGDWVEPGQVLGVFYSVDVGNKKNDLFDALLQADLDKVLLEKAEANIGVPEVFLLNARRNYLGDRNAILRAENTLRAYGVPEEDIEQVRREAKTAIESRGKDARTAGKGDKESATREQLERWARVNLTSPIRGVIVERNVSQNEMIQDATIPLFQVADVDQMMLVINAPEEDLKPLLELMAQKRRKGESIPWVIQTATVAEKEGLQGWINDISYVLDVNQHSLVVKGYINNPMDEPEPGQKHGHPRLRAGQFVTATIDMPVPKDIVEVPATAIADAGNGECYVFVETDADKHRYKLRRVEVTHRFENAVYVRSKAFSPSEALTREEKKQGLPPREALKPGERVLATGVLELKKELEIQESSGE